MEFGGKGFQFPQIPMFGSASREIKGMLNEIFSVQMKESPFLHNLKGINSFITRKAQDYNFDLAKHYNTSVNLVRSSHSH